jgi:hypothetical protein
MGCNQSTEQKPATTAGQQPQALPDTSNAKESINTAGESTADTPAAPYEPNNVVIGANDEGNVTADKDKKEEDKKDGDVHQAQSVEQEDKKDTNVLQPQSQV